jgi:hypothetical protein
MINTLVVFDLFITSHYVLPEYAKLHKYMLWNIQYVPGGNVPDFGRMFLELKYTDITKNTYIRS